MTKLVVLVKPLKKKCTRSNTCSSSVILNETLVLIKKRGCFFSSFFLPTNKIALLTIFFRRRDRNCDQHPVSPYSSATVIRRNENRKKTQLH